MTQPLIPRNGTAPLHVPQTPQWSTNWNLGSNAPPPAAGAPAPAPAIPGLPVDAVQGLEGQAALDAAARAGGAEAPRRFNLATPPRVDPPAPVVPSVSLSGSTENRIATLIQVQQGQFEAIASALSGMGFTIDPNKTSLGLTGTQRFYADLVGVLMGVEDVVKEIPEFRTLHQLYTSMPSQLTDQQLQDLQGVWGKMIGFQEMVKAATTLRSQINDAKAKKNQRDVEWFEGRLELLISGQRDEVRAMAGELQRLGYAIDPSKTSIGLTGAQQFFAELVGVFTGAEDGVKDTPEYRTLHQLYASMPNDLSEQQLRELGGVASRLQEFNSTVRQINDRRVQISKARANNNPGEVRRLEQEIEGLTATQRTAVNGMVGELQRLNYQIDPNKTSIGLTGAQRLYADIVGVLTGVEDVVKEIPEFKELHELYMSMPNQLSDQQLQDLWPVYDRLQKFPDTVKAITTLRRQINDAKANKNQRDVEWYESRIQLVIESQRSGVRALVADLRRLNYTVDPDKISLGLTGTQQFYADVVGVLQAAEDDVKAMDEYKLFHQLYLSMPNQLTDQQLRDLGGVKDRMKAFADAAKTINNARVQINVARAAKDEGSVRFYEQQIAAQTGVQRTELQAMVRGLQGLNYQVDPNKTSLGLTGTQRFYADLVGVLMGVEDVVKEIPEYRTLHQLYASMPSQLSDRQLRDLQGAWDRMGRFQESVKEVASVHKQITEAKAKKNQGEVKRLEGQLAQLVAAQRDDVRALVAELQRLNYTIDESKTSLGLTGSQQFYNDLSGILTMAESEVKETPAFQTLSRLYASMPSELSDQQLRQLRGLWAQIRGVDPISDQINALRVLLVQEKAKANA